MATGQEALQLMFTRPCEPIFLPKDGKNSVVFEVPDSYVNSRFKDIKKKMKGKFETVETKTVVIENIAIPDLTVPLKLKRNENFTLFYPKHKDMAQKLIDVFMKQKTVQDLLSIAAYCHDKINPYLFNYALSVAILHREDTRDISLPNFLEVFPGKFVDSGVFSKVRQEVIVPQENREPIILARDFTANSREPEQKCSYFREDLGINLHHWHWHLVYPTGAEDRAIVAKDRRGELFYYMHQQVLARYNAERFANDLGYVKPYTSFREAIPEGYFPKMEMRISSRPWPSRVRNSTPQDIDRPQDDFVFNISEIEGWLTNIKDAIDKGFAVTEDGNQIPLTQDKGIDVLGDMIEASMLTPNGALYGSAHNIGHVLFALCHDPDGRFLESFGVMGDTATAMRDPIFYRWHCFINSLFVSHKDSLPAYTLSQLEFKKVSIASIQVISEDNVTNQLNTFWQQSDVDVSRGLDFSPRGPVKIRFTHLQHSQFIFNVKVRNASSQQLTGFMRIFMAPTINDKGVSMTFNEQRKLMIELDKFKVNLKKGDNLITRSSVDSSVTIPYERTFRSLDAGRPADGDAQLNTFNFCGCGWPHHMLIPKGTENGMKFDLFVMISDYQLDKVDQDITGVCNDADSYCGIQDKKYPDKRSMGFPFDRIARIDVTNLSEFLTSNMKTAEVTVKFTERIVVAPQPKEISVVTATAV